MRNETCATCTYFVADRTICKRYPPTVTAVVMEEEYCYGPNYRHDTREIIVKSTDFPEVEADNWCGEWAAAAELPETHTEVP